MITYARETFHACFPRARLYAPAPEGDPRELHERGGRARSFPYIERHLQCVWFDPALRPPALVSVDGEPVAVEDPGVWNLEAGPDFLGAALRIGEGQRRIAGDVEIHVHPSDWIAHRHRADPRYNRVRVHVTYFPGRLPESELPSGAVQIFLKDALAANPAFAFDHIDLAAYPFAARAAEPPCHAELRNWTADARETLLDAAGEERLRRKAETLAARMEERGRDQVVYEEVMTALGYKQNKSAFRKLASVLPIDVLRDESRNDAATAYALLLGVAGLVPADAAPTWDDETRHFMRSVWDAWWKMRDRWQGRSLPREVWNFAGIRPLNHPIRRLAAAAQLLEQFDACPERLAALRDPYWSYRQGLGGLRSDEPIALLGKDRIRAITINVTIPLLAATGDQAGVARLLADLPPEQDNAIVRQTAANLFGRDHSPKLYATGLRRQGLVQVFHDYCLNDRSRCATCTFPALLRAHRTGR